MKYLKQGRWELLESATTFIVNDAAVSDSTQKVAKINLWLAQKKMRRMNVEEVRKTDFSALTIDYQICKYALLEEYSKAIPLIDKALDTEQITVKSLYEWPVLEDLRKEESFDNMMLTKGITAPEISHLIYPKIDDFDETKEDREEIEE